MKSAFEAAALVAALVSAIVAALGLSVALFDASYLCVNVLLAYSYLQAIGRNERRLLLVCLVLLSFWVALSSGGYYQPKYNSDLNSERLVAQGILNSGHLNLSGPTPKQVYYSTFPGLEILGAILGLVAGVSPYTFIGYGSLLFGVLALILLYLFYRAIAERAGIPRAGEFASRTLLIATWSSAFLAFEALTIHQSLDLVFFCAALLLLAMGKINYEAIVLYSVTAFAMVVSHDLTPVVFLVFLVVYATSSSALSRYQIRPLLSFSRWYLGLFAVALGLFAFLSRTPILLVQKGAQLTHHGHSANGSSSCRDSHRHEAGLDRSADTGGARVVCSCVFGRIRPDHHVTRLLPPSLGSSGSLGRRHLRPSLLVPLRGESKLAGNPVTRIHLSVSFRGAAIRRLNHASGEEGHGAAHASGDAVGPAVGPLPDAVRNRLLRS